jgi:hypothetical protein
MRQGHPLTSNSEIVCRCRLPMETRLRSVADRLRRVWAHSRESVRERIESFNNFGAYIGRVEVRKGHFAGSQQISEYYWPWTPGNWYVSLVET